MEHKPLFGDLIAAHDGLAEELKSALTAEVMNDRVMLQAAFIDDRVMLQRSQTLVIALVGKDRARMWWSTQNRAFEFKTPEEVVATDPVRVYNYLMTMSGADGA